LPSAEKNTRKLYYTLGKEPDSSSEKKNEAFTTSFNEEKKLKLLFSAILWEIGKWETCRWGL